jgi:hypothetical protein
MAQLSGIVALREELTPGDPVVGKLLGDEVASHAFQGLQGQLARVVHRHAVSGEAQLELEGDLREKKTMTCKNHLKWLNLIKTTLHQFFVSKIRKTKSKSFKVYREFMKTKPM